jgi:hypothetical protein
MMKHASPLAGVTLVWIDSLVKNPPGEFYRSTYHHNVV